MTARYAFNTRVTVTQCKNKPQKLHPYTDTYTLKKKKLRTERPWAPRAPQHTTILIITNFFVCLIFLFNVEILGWVHYASTYQQKNVFTKKKKVEVKYFWIFKWKANNKKEYRLNSYIYEYMHIYNIWTILYSSCLQCIIDLVLIEKPLIMHAI